MKKGSYLKLVALDINGFEASIVDDKNVKDINEACEYFTNNIKKIEDDNAIWIILPCQFSVN